MSTADEALLLAIIGQWKDNKIDMKVLARDLGLPTAGAASKRWQRYRKRLAGKQACSPSKPAGVQRTISSLTKKSKKAAKTDGSEGSGLGDEEIPVTPIRRLPGRKARVVKFKEDTTDEDEDEE